MRGRSGPVVLLFLFTCTQVAGSLRAQPPDDPRSLLEAYAAIAERYLQGRADAASELLALGSRRLKALDDLVTRALRQPNRLSSSSDRIWSPHLLRAVAMVHTEIAVRSYRTGDHRGFDEHIESAERTLLLADHVDTASDFRPRWHLAIGLDLFAAADVDKARVHLTRACQLFPGHARLRLACGVSLATYAAMVRPTPDDLSRWHSITAPSTSRQLDEQRRAAMTLTELENAALAHFDAARSADPRLSEASLRAAAIFLERGAAGDAERLLTPLMSLHEPPPLVYLAGLMLGRLREQQGQLADAEALYREAMALLPHGSRARVALANLLHATGARAAAREIVEQLVTPRLSPPDDPWAMYPLELIATSRDTLDDLQREVRK